MLIGKEAESCDEAPDVIEQGFRFGSKLPFPATQLPAHFVYSARGMNVVPITLGTIKLRNDGLHPHNLSVPSQGIDLNCGVRAHGKVEVAFPRSGVLVFTCKYTATSGMRGALAVKGPDVSR